MSVPAALLARLAKRGIISDKDLIRNLNENSNKKVLEEEEVIAECYDEGEKKTKETGSYIELCEEFLTFRDLKFQGYSGCPNKYNVWHECCLFCKNHWGEDLQTPKKKYMELKKKMLEKYPLPSNWSEVYDPGTGRHYYWDEENDCVSWLPPLHPKAIVTDSAAHFREERFRVLKNKKMSIYRVSKNR